MKLKGQVALITGGGRGIGRAIAERFAAEGAAVMLASRTEAELQATAEAIRRSAGRAEFLPGDVADEAFIARLLEETQRRLGAVDILVNNAGVYGPVRPLADYAPADWDRVLSVNLRAPFLLTRALLPRMMERGRGVILNLSTTSAKLAYPASGAYAASKAGLLALTRTSAAEGARAGVRVNALCPGPVEGTRMWRELGEEFQKIYHLTAEQLAETSNAEILQGRPQKPEEVAAAALFLCSEDARAITGQAVNVDGGNVFY